MRKALLIMFLLCFSILGSWGAFMATASVAPKKIVVFLPSADNPFWIEVRRGIESLTTELGDSITLSILTSGDLDAASQIEQLTTVLSRKSADAIVIGIADNRAPAPVIARYNQAQIPVVMIDTKLDIEAANNSNATYDAFIGSDNRLGGVIAAKEMVKKLEGVSNKSILLIKGSYIHQSAIDRAEGFIAGLAGHWNILDRDGEWSRQRATEITIGVMKRQPVKGIFAGNDDMALGAVAALKSLNLPREKLPLIIGFDATPAGIAAVKEGYMYASVKQDPRGMGRTGVMLAVDLLNGKEIKKETLIPVVIAHE